MAEETLGEIVARFQASKNKTRNTDHPAADPMIYPTTCPPRTPLTAPAPPPRTACAAPKQISTKCRQPAAKPNSPPRLCGGEK
jgi:hypothetical protein